jgi:RanBP-type and C3HC4-type zinc finger-containing protein 1
MRPGCEICSTARPDSYRLPEDYTPDASERELMQKLNLDEQALEAVQKELEEERQKNLDDLMATDFKDYIENTEPFECPICIVEYEQGEGIVLRNCLHVMCKDCFRGHCINSDEADVKCPYVGDDYQCDGFITEREMRGLLTEEEFLKIEQKGLMKAEGAFANSFHCRTADCHGWCVYEDEVNEFPCPICNKLNCLLCKAIHEGMNCKEYQDDIARKAANDEAAKATKEFMERMVTQGDAMVCPSCGVIVQKKDGCDWIMCSVCKTELCWATKGPRWGPKGKGDLTGGCKCNFRGKRCHPKCRNCH